MWALYAQSRHIRAFSDPERGLGVWREGRQPVVWKGFFFFNGTWMEITVGSHAVVPDRREKVPASPTEHRFLQFYLCVCIRIFASLSPVQTREPHTHSLDLQHFTQHEDPVSACPPRPLPRPPPPCNHKPFVHLHDPVVSGLFCTWNRTACGSGDWPPHSARSPGGPSKTCTSAVCSCLFPKGKFFENLNSAFTFLQPPLWETDRGTMYDDRSTWCY